MSLAQRQSSQPSKEFEHAAAVRLFSPTEELPQSQLWSLLKLARPHQWVKNVFVLIPVFLSPELISLALTARAFAAASVFCVLASAIYVINDISDQHADRMHPVKRSRPLASGAIATWQAVLLAIGLLSIAAPASLSLGSGVALICGIYLVTNLAYTFHFKHKPIIDVMLVAMCYVLRVYAGSYAIGIEPTIWLVNCTGFLALFIALAKRRDDVVRGFQ